MSTLSYGTNQHYEYVRDIYRDTDDAVCSNCVCCLPIIIPVKALIELCKYPYKRRRRNRLKKVFNRWRETLTESDKALVEKYIHGPLELSTFYKLTPYNCSKCSQLKVLFYIKRHHPYREDVVEHLMAIPPFLLYIDYKIPDSYTIQVRLKKMLQIINDVYKDNPDHTGFRFLNHNARERFEAQQKAQSPEAH